MRQWTVTYDANGGSGAPAAQKAPGDKALTLSAGQLAEFGAESRKIAEKDLGKDAFSRRYLAIFRTEE